MKNSESISVYNDEWLAAKLPTLIKSKEVVPFDELVDRIKVYLGFQRAAESFRQKIEGALALACRDALLVRNDDGIRKP